VNPGATKFGKMIFPLQPHLLFILGPENKDPNRCYDGLRRSTGKRDLETTKIVSKSLFPIRYCLRVTISYQIS
jgi:hypothetical protein